MSYADNERTDELEMKLARERIARALIEGGVNPASVDEYVRDRVRIEHVSDGKFFMRTNDDQVRGDPSNPEHLVPLVAHAKAVLGKDGTAPSVENVSPETAAAIAEGKAAADEQKKMTAQRAVAFR